MKTSKYFKPAEFERCSPSCSIEDMDQDFLNKMDEIREKVWEYAKIPLIINSAYRSAEWDKSKGRSGTGAHTLGMAVDFRANASTTRMLIVKAALACGIRRIGIEGSFVHVDISPDHDQDVMWTY